MKKCPTTKAQAARPLPYSADAVDSGYLVVSQDKGIPI